MFSQNIKLTIIVLVFAVLFIGIGFFGAEMFVQDCSNNTGVIVSPKLIAQDDNTFQAGWEAAKKRLEESNFLLSLDSESSITSVSGVIMDIEKGILFIEINPLEPLADPDLDIRVVKLNDDTNIIQRTEKNMEVFEKEMMEYDALMQSIFSGTVTDADKLTEAPNPPSSYNSTNVKVDKLSVGMTITITANSDIKETKEFNAKEIAITQLGN